jgi:AcrR family transcriptional regulator
MFALATIGRRARVRGEPGRMSDPDGRLPRMNKLHLPNIQIAHAAFHIYAAEGPKGLTMRKVAAAVGVRASALYRHYRNKEELVDVVATLADQALADKLRAPAKQQPRKGRTRPMLGRALDFAVEQPRLFRLATTHRPRWRDTSCAARNIVAAEVGQAKEKGELRKGNEENTTTAIWAHICGLAAIHGRGDLPGEWRPLRRDWLAAARPIIDGLRPEQRAA